MESIMEPKSLTNDDDFEIVKIVPVLSDDIRVSVHPSPKKKNMVVSIKPPLKPASEISHVPCDIVLVIDISSSMSSPAPPPPTADDDEKPEETGLSVLDLTKHAARTIIQTLNEKDRLAVVTFSNFAEIIYPLSSMTEENKKQVVTRITGLEPIGITNLWDGLRKGLQSIKNAPSLPSNVQAIYLLTDGQPNHMCPREGYVPKLQEVLKSHEEEKSVVPSIHTFGFGYDIRSGLLQSISEVGAGTYAFIPDPGMIGTVFVHGVANLYSTFATQAKLTIHTKRGEKTISVGNVQYGQSRDVVVNYDDIEGTTPVGPVRLTYISQGVSNCKIAGEPWETSDADLMAPAVYDYHLARAQVCDFLRTLYPRRPDQELVPVPAGELPRARAKLEDLIKQLKARGHTDEQNTSLLLDLAGDDPSGQVRLAISKDKYYLKWGRHYLLSVLNAHAHQICNTFKDPGPLQYGKDSPLFCHCRKELDDCFDNLPPPRPSLFGHNANRAFAQGWALSNPGSVGNNDAKRPPVKMSRWNKSSNPCFAGHCRIRIEPDGGSVPMRDIRSGMLVWTPRGQRQVKAVVATRVRHAPLCGVGSLWITPWHPIQHENGWVFPWMVSDQDMDFSGDIYSILLEPHPDHDAHSVMIGDRVCVSLGHGIQKGHDVRAHEFFGSYHRVTRSLYRLPRDSNGIFRCSGIRRHPRTGLASDFIGYRRDRKHWSNGRLRGTLKSGGSTRKLCPPTRPL